MMKKTALFVLLLLAPAAWGFDYPLSSQAIREAYFQGKREAGLGTEFLAKYSLSIPELKVEPYVSRVRIETPFLQVAEHASKVLSYSAQDAVKDFYGKPMVLRMYLEICYEVDAPLPSLVRISVTQNNKQLTVLSDERTSFFPPSDVYTRVPNLGEKITLEFDPAKVDSSTLTIRIETPDGRDTSVEVDFRSLR
jgi:hypothetical protein